MSANAFQILTFATQQALDTAANVLSGATLTFSLTGTSTPTNAYSDPARTIPLANPLSADAAGNFVSVFLDPLIVYRVVLKTSAGAVLKTWDPANENVLGLITQSYIGALLYPPTAAEISAAVTPVNYAIPSHDAVGTVIVDRYGVNTTPGTTNMTTAIQNAIAVAQAIANGAEVRFLAAEYKAVSQLLISGNGITLRGAGMRSTRLTFAPTANGSLLKFINGATTINQIALRDIALWSADSTFTKTAIDITDASGLLLERVLVNGSVPVSGVGYWSGAGSIALRIHGRETSSISNCFFVADNPIIISTNPNGSISLDHFNFHNLYMIGNGNPLITVEAGCTLTQISFTGHQAWVRGTGGFYWVDATSPGSSNGLVFQNVRYENSTDATKYAFQINPTSPLQGLIFQGGQTGLSRGFHLRNVQKASFDSWWYNDATREAMNVDATVGELDIRCCFWQNGSTATLTGLKTIHGLSVLASGPLPETGRVVTAPGVVYDELCEVSLSSGPISLAANATFPIAVGTDVATAFLTASDGTGAQFLLKGTNHATIEISDPDTFFSITKDTASSYNVYWDATALSGVGAYVVQNKFAATKQLRIMRLGGTQ